MCHIRKTDFKQKAAIMHRRSTRKWSMELDDGVHGAGMEARTDRRPVPAVVVRHGGCHRQPRNPRHSTSSRQWEGSRPAGASELAAARGVDRSRSRPRAYDFPIGHRTAARQTGVSTGRNCAEATRYADKGGFPDSIFPGPHCTMPSELWPNDVSLH